MEQISNIISKKVVSVAQGIGIGYVLNVVFGDDLNVVEGFLVVDDENDKVSFLQYTSVKSITDNYIIIDSQENLFFGEMIESNNPINKLLLTENGDFLGKVIDVFINKNKVVKIITNNGECYPRNIISHGREYLFFGQKKRKKTKNIFPKIENNNGLPTIEIQDKNIKNDVKNNNLIEIPLKLTASSKNIIGKIATTDIFGYNNEIIIRKDEKITEKTVKKAKKHEKLNFLLFNNR